jgi:hypothetical protein
VCVAFDAEREYSHSFSPKANAGVVEQALVVAFCASLSLWNWWFDLAISAGRVGERDRRKGEMEEVEENSR